MMRGWTVGRVTSKASLFIVGNNRRMPMPIYKIEGVKGDHKVAEHAHSRTKAEWVAASYVEHGYKVEISEVTPLTSGSM
jgi:hypothetical protein